MEEYSNPSNFIDELLAEVEAQEQKLSMSHADLIVLEIAKLQSQIARTIKESEEEIKIIQNWALSKNVKLQERAELLQKKLEFFIRETGDKTVDLPHGILKIRKKPDRVEITDLESFLANANSGMLTTVPESVKPDLNKIKAVIKTSGRTPEGVTVITGNEEFSLKIKEINNDD